MPIEAAFSVAFQYDQNLFGEAFDRGIVIVSPTTLLATLRTVHSIWRYEKQNRNAEKIAQEAGNCLTSSPASANHLKTWVNSWKKPAIATMRR
jgi:DNA anti-recombination protein RmuC